MKLMKIRPDFTIFGIDVHAEVRTDEKLYISLDFSYWTFRLLKLKWGIEDFFEKVRYGKIKDDWIYNQKGCFRTIEDAHNHSIAWIKAGKKNERVITEVYRIPQVNP